MHHAALRLRLSHNTHNRLGSTTPGPAGRCGYLRLPWQTSAVWDCCPQQPVCAPGGDCNSGALLALLVALAVVCMHDAHRVGAIEQHAGSPHQQPTASMLSCKPMCLQLGQRGSRQAPGLWPASVIRVLAGLLQPLLCVLQQVCTSRGAALLQHYPSAS